ncbi:MAG: V-type ATP synthase subunit I [Candidatus Thorarchaeota archaeon]|jgi:V/A-type H+-transporting ATPase subunit I
MGLMSPKKMIVAKVVSHRDNERQVLMSLEDFSLFEFIDVRKQAGIVDVKRTREEETVFSAHERLTRVLESLDIDYTRKTGVLIDVDDITLESSLKLASEVITSVEEEILDIDSKSTIAQLELDRQRGVADVARSLEPLGIDPSLIGTTEYTFTTAGLVPSGQESELEWSIGEVTDGAFTIGTLPLKRGGSACVLTVPIELKEAVERILSAMQFEAFSIPEGYEGKPEEIALEANEKMVELEKEIEQHQLRKEHIANEWGTRILAAWEVLLIESRRVDIKSYVVYTDQSIKMWGWIPDGMEEEFESLLSARVGSALEVTFDKPHFAEHDAPTYISNPSAMEPTEDVVKAFGIPSRHDLDPTKVMFLSFPLIFGLVFADIGQGFLILLIGLAALRAKRKGEDWGAIMSYIQSGAQGLIMMGIFAIIGGFLFGSFFGAETVFEPLWPTFAHYIDDGHGHLILNPYRATHMLKLSIEIGAIHIMIGIILNIYNKFKHREMSGLVVGISYLWLYYGFINLLFGVSYSSVGDWFSSSGQVNLWVPIAGIGYGIGNNGVYPAVPIAPMTFSLVAFIVPFIIMALASFKGGMDGFVLFLEYAIGMISHTVSYARIFALNTVHIILSGVFFSLIPAIVYIPFPELTIFGVELIPHEVHSNDPMAPHGPHLPLLGAIIGTFIVGILEGLLAFMHTLRLHFVEWFSKFYHAGGVEFQPFRTERLFTARAVQEAVATPVVS